MVNREHYLKALNVFKNTVQTNVSTDLIQPEGPQLATHTLTLKICHRPSKEGNAGYECNMTSEVTIKGTDLSLYPNSIIS